jgi:hypothetical protein
VSGANCVEIFESLVEVNVNEEGLRTGGVDVVACEGKDKEEEGAGK